MQNKKQIKTIYGKKGYTLIKKYFTSEQIEKVKNDLMMLPYIPEDFGNNARPFPIYLENDNKLYIPKHYGFEHFGQPDQIKISKGDPINLTFKGTMKETQVPIINSYIESTTNSDESLATKSNGGLISVPCGVGKTACAINLISLLGRKALVVVHKEFLLNQWVGEIKNFLPGARIGTIQGQKIDIENKDIVIGMLQSLSMKDYPDDLFDSFGTVAIDECFPYEQYVLTNQGREKIGSLYQKWKNNESELPLIKSFNTKLKIFEWKKMTYAWEKNNDKLIEITFTNNKQFKSTYNHLYLTTHGWIEAHNLSIGDIVISNNNESVMYVRDIIYIDNTNKNVYDIEVADNHNFIICDSDDDIGCVVHNCHHISAEVFSRALPKINCWYSIGLSATPNRADGLQKVMHHYLGPMIYRIDKRDDRKVRVNVIRFKDNNPEYSSEELSVYGKVCVPRMVTNIVNFTNRNILINCIIKRLVADKRHVLVLSDRREHLNVIYNMVKEYTTVGFYVGGMKQKDLDISAKMDVVLGTYPMSSEGLNIPDLDAAVFTTSKSSIEQSIGRIIRKAHERMPVAFDIVDGFSVFPRQYSKREKVYKKLNYDVYELNIKSENNSNEASFDYQLDKTYKKKEFKRGQVNIQDSDSNPDDSDLEQDDENVVEDIEGINKMALLKLVQKDMKNNKKILKQDYCFIESDDEN